MFLFGTTIADWLMKSATNAIKVGTNNSRARPSNHVTRFKQDPCPRPFCTKIWNIWKNLNYQIESTYIAIHNPYFVARRVPVLCDDHFVSRWAPIETAKCWMQEKQNNKSNSSQQTSDTQSCNENWKQMYLNLKFVSKLMNHMKLNKLTK